MKLKLISLILVMLLCQICPATVTSTSVKTTTTCDNSTVAFTFTFPIVQSSDLTIILRVISTGVETTLTETTHYTVSATNNDYSSGGTVTTVATYDTTYTLTLLRNVPDTQNTDLDDSGVLRLQTLENALDRLTMLVQQLQEQSNRAPLAPPGETLTMTLPSSVTRASQYFGFTSTGIPTVLSSGLDVGDTTLSSYMETVVESADEAAFKANTNLESGTDVLAYDAGLQNLAGVSMAANKFYYTSADNIHVAASVTSAARDLLDDAAASNMRTTLGLAIGSNVQAYDPNLTAFAGLASTSNKIPYFTGAATMSMLDFVDATDLGTDSNTALVSEAAIKSYVDGKANPAYSGGESYTFEGTLTIKSGVTGSITTGTTVSYGTGFGTATISVIITANDTTNTNNATAGSVTKDNFILYHNKGSAGAYYWIAIGH